MELDQPFAAVPTNASPYAFPVARPVVVPLADARMLKHYVGLSPARARKLHVTEGFPLRFPGDGARRSPYVILDEVEKWWSE